MALQTLTVSAAIENIENEALTITGVKTFATTPLMNAISERTATTGVTVDGCLIKDGSAALSGTTSNPLGAWVDKSASYAAQQASTDGFVISTLVQSNTETSSGSAASLTGKTDSATTPTVVRGYANTSKTRDNLNADVRYSSFCMPVKKSDYWSVTYAVLRGSPTTTIAVYWIPLGV